ncbi:MAG: hypothetical protein ABII06_21695 [Pseudomonadota bacterium]
MTREDKGHYALKHSPDRKPDQQIIDAVKKRISDGTLSCAEAFSIAEELNTLPEEIGVTLDLLEIRIVKCQLGLHGYKTHGKKLDPVETVAPELEEAVRKGLVNDRLPCASAWKISGELGLGKMEVSSACEALKVKISSCQLGAF